MKAEAKSKPKAPRFLHLIEEQMAETPPEIRYYNAIVIAANVIFEMVDVGDIELLDRLRKLAVLSVELACRPASIPFADLASEAGSIKSLPADCPIFGLPF